MELNQVEVGKVYLVDKYFHQNYLTLHRGDLIRVEQIYGPEEHVVNHIAFKIEERAIPEHNVGNSVWFCNANILLPLYPNKLEIGDLFEIGRDFNHESLFLARGEVVEIAEKEPRAAGGFDLRLRVVKVLDSGREFMKGVNWYAKPCNLIEHGFYMGNTRLEEAQSSREELVNTPNVKAVTGEDEGSEDSMEEKKVFICASCGSVIVNLNNRRQHEYNGLYYCDDCWDKEFGTCQWCGEVFPKEELVDGPDGELYCESCRGERFVECCNCGDEIDIDDAVESGNGDYYCQDCYDNTFATCCQCGEEVALDDAHEDDYGDYYCENCWEDRCREEHEDPEPNKVLHDYHYFSDSDEDTSSYGMPFLFDGSRQNKCVTGVELEMVGGGYNESNARKILDVMGDDHLKIMYDGSLYHGDSDEEDEKGGFELVSCPATVKYQLTTVGWDKGIKKALELGYISHNSGTCGLHVHMDREFFENGVEPESTEMKMYVFLRNNLNWLKDFSRRRKYDYCIINGSDDDDYSDPDTRDNNHKYTVGDVADKIYLRKKVGTGNRHLALNFTNDNTIEFRIFRGTLKYSTFVATLQFVDMFAELIKSNDLEGVVELGLQDFIDRANTEGYKEFISYIKERNITSTCSGDNSSTDPDDIPEEEGSSQLALAL